VKRIHLLALVAVVAHFSCTDSPTGPEENEIAEDYSRLTSSLSSQLTNFRGKPFKRSVATVVYTRTEYRNSRERTSDHLSESDRDRINRILRCEGFVRPNDDFFEGYETMLDNDIGGYYEPGTDTIVVVIEDGATTIAEDDSVTMFHELAHALQDQYYDLTALTGQMLSSDERYALQYTIEGEATLLTDCYGYYLYYGYYPTSKTPLYTVYDYYHGVIESRLDSLHTAGEILYAYQPFYWGYYSYGPEFIMANMQGMDFDQIDTKVFQSLPAKTREVLHPDVYNSGDRSGYTIDLRDVTNELDDTFIIYDDDELGEVLTSVLLREWDIEAYKRRAEGLLADRVVVFGNRSVDSLRMIWYTLWESSAKSREFFNTYDDVVGSKRSVTLPVPVQSDSGLTISTNYVHMEQDSNAVIVVEHFSDTALDSWLAKLRSVVPNSRVLAKRGDVARSEYPFVDKARLTRREPGHLSP
jgi:hypothetical protein